MSDLSTKPIVVVLSDFDNLKSPQVRFLQEASRLGDLHVMLYSDDLSFALNGKMPKFSETERQYFLQSIRYVGQVSIINSLPDHNSIPDLDKFHRRKKSRIIWAVSEEGNNAQKEEFCVAQRIEYRVINRNDLVGFPPDSHPSVKSPTDKKVLVTGSFDWLHTGHVRFFEEASTLGELYVVVGHDANIKLLKGEGHPLFPQDERRYMVQSIRFVKQALISSGHGWMDAEPEIAHIHPDYYVVNEDGDKPEKRFFCANHDLEYKVLKRLPKPGLPRRESTALRGF